ncbi:MAG: hypothetical protein A2W22_05855 [Candidatus Levybacteria bacterium RBG_16_35_11]|nr:MAG: hypothetical protein A2W22_05855 [Candidatus Levybacteria bacterium RBG_16_35_11]
MKVSNVMSTNIDSVRTNTSVKDVARLIFGRGINGVPVCKDRKLVGFITEKDILAKFYPTIHELAEDYVHASDFESMEKKVDEIFSLKAENIMSKNPVTVSPKMPLLRAQSLMFVKKIGRLPVVDEHDHLIGMLTKGDVFRAAVGDSLPYAGEEEYHDWQVRHYDVVTNWEERLKNEIPDLVNLFKKHKAKRIIDIGYGTGEHDIALAKKGFEVYGIESSFLMAKAANEKLKKLPEAIRRKLTFAAGNYVDVLSDKKEEFDAAIFMGNAFPHLFTNYKEVLKAVSHVLPSKNASIVLQIINIDKMVTVNKRVFDVIFGVPKKKFPAEQAFLRFFDPPKTRNDTATLNTAVFDSDGRRWKFRSINSTPVIYLSKDKVENLLKKNGFNSISFYGGRFLGPLFRESFKPKESDILNVVAKR